MGRVDHSDRGLTSEASQLLGALRQFVVSLVRPSPDDSKHLSPAEHSKEVTEFDSNYADEIESGEISDKPLIEAVDEQGDVIQSAGEQTGKCIQLRNYDRLSTQSVIQAQT